MSNIKFYLIIRNNLDVLHLEPAHDGAGHVLRGADPLAGHHTARPPLLPLHLLRPTAVHLLCCLP